MRLDRSLSEYIALAWPWLSDDESWFVYKEALYGAVKYGRAAVEMIRSEHLNH